MVLCGAIAALAVIIVGIILLAKGCSGGTDALAGTWEFDGTTTYSFDGSGSGAMELPSIEKTVQPRKRGYTVSLSKNILTGLWLTGQPFFCSWMGEMRKERRPKDREKRSIKRKSSVSAVGALIERPCWQL